MLVTGGGVNRQKRPGARPGPIHEAGVANHFPSAIGMAGRWNKVSLRDADNLSGAMTIMAQWTIAKLKARVNMHVEKSHRGFGWLERGV